MSRSPLPPTRNAFLSREGVHSHEGRGLCCFHSPHLAQLSGGATRSKQSRERPTPALGSPWPPPSVECSALGFPGLGFHRAVSPRVPLLLGLSSELPPDSSPGAVDRERVLFSPGLHPHSSWPAEGRNSVRVPPSHHLSLSHFLFLFFSSGSH